MSEMRRVTAIRNGTVVDHVPAGRALLVLRMLRVDGAGGSPVSLVMNCPSDKIGVKDIVKVEDRELTQTELDRLALIAPNASVAIIRSHAVAEKRTVTLRDEVVGVARCAFYNCITRTGREPLPHRLHVLGREPVQLRCHYCRRDQPLAELVEHLL